jgi:hypothetical protein
LWVPSHCAEVYKLLINAQHSLACFGTFRTFGTFNVYGGSGDG